MELVAGRRPVIEALLGRREVRRVFVAAEIKSSETVARIIKLAGAGGIQVETVGADEIRERFAGLHDQGVGAEVSDYHYFDIGEIEQATAAAGSAFVIALDQVTDPQNLGAVIRTAVAAGAAGILIGRHRSAAVTPAVVRAAAGLTERAVIVRTNLSAGLERLKKSGFWTVGTDSHRGDPPWRIDLTGKIVLVLGSEGSGLSRLVAEKCDFFARLPLAEGVDSLNISAAAAAAAFEVVRQTACAR